MIKKNIRRYLGIIILICGIIFSATCVYATQSRTENFDKTYSLGTNQADNLINVAQKQIGKSKSNLGYTEAWCADFACDCAKLTGMSEAIIPYNYGSRGACTSLYNYMVKNCSAKVVSSREKGNLVFYYCSGCNRYVHVGIVIDDTYSIEGNYDGKVTKVKNSYTDSAGHTLASGKITRKYLRPNYSNSTPDSTINNSYYNSYGFDVPSSNSTISESTFLFQGWIDAKKKISTITCSINHGAHYVEAALYKRPDVPNATAFRVEANANLLKTGKNDVALCVNFADGTATVVENRSVTWSPKLIWGYDSPTDGMKIVDNQFPFYGWIESARKLDRVTCSLNQGEKYLTANLYKRPDVPNATAFRLDIDTSNLHYGDNSVSICAHYADGSSQTIATRKVRRSISDAIEYPQNNEKFTCKNSKFLLQGWSTNDSKEIDHFAFTINGTKFLTSAHTRSDLSGNARYYREEILLSRIKNGNNKIEIFAYYTDGTSRNIGQVNVVGDIAHTWDAGKVTQEATCNAAGTKTYTCTICQTTRTEEIPATGKHQNTEVRNQKEATCAEEGYTGDTYCKDCGTKLSSGEKIAKTGHKWDAGKVTQEATCNAAGTKTYTCTTCQTTRTEEIPATGKHHNTEVKNQKEATCTEEGYTGDTYCKDCGTKLSSGETITKTGHKWDSGKVTQEATCNKSGTKTYTCTTCQTTRTEEIPATGKHQNTEVKNQKEATCTEEGYTGDTYCKDCGTKLSSGKTIAKTGHKWDAGKVTQEATCTEKGIKTYTCLTCGSIRTEELPSTGHQNTEVRNNREATCMKEGYTGDTYCKDCGTKLSSGKVISKTEHQWDNGKTTQEATCTSKGIKTYTCAICESTRIEELPSTGHRNTELRNTKEATCIEEGYTGDIYCKDCGARISAGQKISKTAHNWDNGKTTQEATCTSGGVKTYTCTNCQATRTEEIPATGHGTQITKFAKKASCKSEGYTGDIYCQTCGEMLKEGDVLPKTEHSWDSGRVTKQPTVTATGVMTYTCRNCKTTKTSAIAKLKLTKLTPGKTVRDNASNGIYKVLKDGVTVEFTKPITKRTTVKIPDTVKISGITCKVTGIASNAFKNNTTLKTITIGKNVATIGTNAFYGCKNLVKVSGGNGIVKISNKAFGNCINLTGITISQKVRSIGTQAFYNCKKLKTIIIKTGTLTTGNVGAKAFAGTYPKPTVKVPAKQIKIYGKLLKTKGMSTKAIYKQ